MFTFLCVLGTSKCMENVWKGHNFHRYIPHDKGPFKFCRTSWLLHFSFKTPPPGHYLRDITTVICCVEVQALYDWYHIIISQYTYLYIGFANPIYRYVYRLITTLMCTHVHSQWKSLNQWGDFLFIVLHCKLLFQWMEINSLRQKKHRKYHPIKHYFSNNF